MLHNKNYYSSHIIYVLKSLSNIKSKKVKKNILI